MKKVIKLKDNINNKESSIEVNVRDEGHLLGCIKYPSIIFKNKKKYNRKKKYKENYFDNEK